MIILSLYNIQSVEPIITLPLYNKQITQLQSNIIHQSNGPSTSLCDVTNMMPKQISSNERKELTGQLLRTERKSNDFGTKNAPKNSIKFNRIINEKYYNRLTRGIRKDYIDKLHMAINYNNDVMFLSHQTQVGKTKLIIYMACC